jgi:hypothetical protein
MYCARTRQAKEARCDARNVEQTSGSSDSPKQPPAADILQKAESYSRTHTSAVPISTAAPASRSLLISNSAPRIVCSNLFNLVFISFGYPSMRYEKSAIPVFGRPNSRTVTPELPSCLSIASILYVSGTLGLQNQVSVTSGQTETVEQGRWTFILR